MQVPLAGAQFAPTDVDHVRFKAWLERMQRESVGTDNIIVL